MVIRGYRIKETGLKEIKDRLRPISDKIKRTADKLYTRLLADEMAFICDMIVLNVFTRNEGDIIFDAASLNLDKKIMNASKCGFPSRFVFSVYVQLFDYNDETYMKAFCENEAFLPAFKDLEEISVNEEEARDEKNAKTMLWTDIHRICSVSKMEPLSLNLSPSPVYKKELLKFEDVEKRALKHARWNLMNRDLSFITQGEQIQPYLLMRYMDEVTGGIPEENGPGTAYDLRRKTAIRLKAAELKRLLPDLNRDDSVCFKPYSTAMPETFEAHNEAQFEADEKEIKNDTDRDVAS